MFAAGGLLGLLAVAVPHGANVNELAWALNSSLGLPVALLLFRVAAKVNDALVHLLLVLGGVMVSLGIVFGGGGPAAVATSFFFVWIALYVAWFFSPRATATHLIVDSVAMAAMLGVNGTAAGPAVWLLVMGTALVVSVVVTLLRRELVRVATSDALTGLPTRHVLSVVMNQEIARAARTGAPLCLAMLDVDGLKTINDEQGHQAGDRALVAAAAAWSSVLRESDLIVRFGGDEFVAVLPAITPPVARELIARLREASDVACSIGLAWWREGEDLDSVLVRADKDLYTKRAAARARRASELA
jgi:diguanylate cyclase (GGDEF)-like protein